MNISNTRETATLFIGDLLFLTLSLWLMLFVRNIEFPSNDIFYLHLLPFSMIFLVSVLIFYIAGMYEKQTVILKSRLPSVIFKTQIINSVIAVLFFYFIPYFGIAPKTNLFIYVFISFILIVIWRLYIYNFFAPRKVEHALIIGAGWEMHELEEEINRNGNYGLRFVDSIDLDSMQSNEVESHIKNLCGSGNISIMVIDLEHDKVKSVLPALYSLIFCNIRFVAMYKIYEDVFKRIPFSILQYNWFLENISASPKKVYDALKRLVDITLAVVGVIITLLTCPFVALAIWLDDRGALFIVQERIGKGGKKIKILKFRSMNTNDRGIWVKEKDERITRVGNVLRKLRIDEFPQFWNVLKGDLAVIGPRPDIYDLGLKLDQEIPYYAVRNVIPPGLSGWAQISQDLPPQSLEETKLRLAYDLYYVKNRSLILDIRIILKTIRTLLSRAGK
jgi:exopolysaccharide biosynthesis polyprenyl glycosylphosphotransferase